ncbi:hypothetical protein [Myxococcus stipitatus]|uniref:hypothetical protein n=1 Tax=Myxococcus stipitatus TaxID=83455 RepID=UPI0030D28AED
MGKAPLGGEKPARALRRSENGHQERTVDGLFEAPLGLVIGAANTNNFKLVRTVLESTPAFRPAPIGSTRQHRWIDSGDDYVEVHNLAEKFHFTLHLPQRGNGVLTGTRTSQNQAHRGWGRVENHIGSAIGVAFALLVIWAPLAIHRFLNWRRNW